MKILITEGENRSSLAATRSLGKKGYQVFVCSNVRKSISSSSKYCKKSFCTPDPISEEHQYLKEIQAIVINEKIELILPMTEPTILILAQNSNQLPPSVTIAAPDLEKIKFIFNKVEVFHLAQKLDVAIPKTEFIKDNNDYFSRNNRIEKFPVVVKPAMSRIQTAKGFLTSGVTYANNKHELDSIYSTKEFLIFPSMIQEKIVGPGTGLFTLFGHNKHLALFSHKRLREKPPSGGVSVVCESVPLDNEMVEASHKLLSEIGWSGVAMVEFKRDDSDGKAKLMEINGRFWGSLQLAISAGVDFPLHLINYLTMEDFRGVPNNYRAGLKLKWLLGTLDHLIIRLKNSDSRLNLPPDSPSKINALVDFLKIKDTNTVFDVFNKRDLGPFLREIIEYGRQLIR